MKKQLKQLRATYTVPHICKALKITLNVWKNLSAGRTTLTQEQTAVVMRVVNTQFIVVDTERGGARCTTSPYNSFLEAAAIPDEPGSHYQIRTIYPEVK